MRSLSRTFLPMALVALAIAVLPGSSALAQGKKGADTKDASFETSDGVELKGTLYPNSGGKRDATVLLLHDFSHAKGGSSQKDRLPDLAKALQADGYVVLTFDFRGFGESKGVNKEKFWDFRKHPHNRLIKGGLKMPESIEQMAFNKNYYPYLINDIAAAKAYLDRLNDQKACNTSSLIVIGAGQGATLGAIWVANECRRKKDKNSGAAAVGLPLELDEPEGRDIAAGVWLTISPMLEGRQVGVPVHRALVEAAQKHKIPMLFLMGKKDTRNDTLVTGYIKAIRNTSKSKPQVQVARIDGTSLAGARLLDPALKVIPLIQTTYLDKRVMESRGNKEWRDREVEKKAYYYVLPGRQPFLNKRVGEKVPPVYLKQFMEVPY